MDLAITSKLDLINFSLGSPGRIENSPLLAKKITEFTNKGGTVVAAVGNDGLWGSINDPGKQIPVIGVGASDAEGVRIAGFSAKGCTVEEFPF